MLLPHCVKNVSTISMTTALAKDARLIATVTVHPIVARERMHTVQKSSLWLTFDPGDGCSLLVRWTAHNIDSLPPLSYQKA